MYIYKYNENTLSTISKLETKSFRKEKSFQEWTNMWEQVVYHPRLQTPKQQPVTKPETLQQIILVGNVASISCQFQGRMGNRVFWKKVHG